MSFHPEGGGCPAAMVHPVFPLPTSKFHHVQSQAATEQGKVKVKGDAKKSS